jgi:hypothetical protein
MNQHPLASKYSAVWEKTLANGELKLDEINKSRFFFEVDGSGVLIMENSAPVPKHFDTYAIVCFPLHNALHQMLDDLWEQFLLLVKNPIAYGVRPQNRHVEIFLFQRPGELFTEPEVLRGINRSLRVSQTMSPFKIAFYYPFLTPDGTIVVPGLDEPAGTVDNFRNKLRAELQTYPQKQSQWVHISLGRILEPIDTVRLKPLLYLMQSHRDQRIGEVLVNELIWTWEKQWYMTDKKILHRRRLS